MTSGLPVTVPCFHELSWFYIDSDEQSVPGRFGRALEYEAASFHTWQNSHLF